MTQRRLDSGSGGISRWFQHNALPLLLVAPSTLLLIGFILAPAINLLGISLTDYSPGLGGKWVGFDNYVSLLQNSGFQAAAIRNVVYVVVVISIQTSIGLAVAVMLDNALPARAIWMALLVAPLAVSPIVAVVCWKYMLDPSFGLINYLLSLLSLPHVLWFSDGTTSMIPIMMVAVWKGFSFIAIVLFAALRSVPNEIKEAARMDGATAFQVFTHVRLPIIVPALTIVVLFETILAVRQFDIVQTMTGGGPGTATELMSNYLYRQAFGNLYFGTGATVGWLMLIVTLLLASLIIWGNYRKSASSMPARPGK